MTEADQLFSYLKTMPDSCENLKERPHIHSQIKALWGTPEFFSYAESLLIMEEGREDRGGLDHEIHREIRQLQQAFARYPDIIALPSLSVGARVAITAAINKQKTTGFSF